MSFLKFLAKPVDATAQNLPDNAPLDNDKKANPRRISPYLRTTFSIWSALETLSSPNSKVIM
jgi:hypothetical protein